MSLPFIDRAAGTIVENGWKYLDENGDYAVSAVEQMGQSGGGDRGNIVLTGFSRGAIACGFIGLRNDQIASLWMTFQHCQHFDDDGSGRTNGDRDQARRSILGRVGLSCRQCGSQGSVSQRGDEGTPHVRPVRPRCSLHCDVPR